MARLWASGRALTSEAAVTLALDTPPATARETAVQDGESPAPIVTGRYQVASAPPSSLTRSGVFAMWARTYRRTVICLPRLCLGNVSRSDRRRVPGAIVREDRPSR